VTVDFNGYECSVQQVGVVLKSGNETEVPRFFDQRQTANLAMLNHGFMEGSDLEYLKSLHIVGSDLEFIPAGFDGRTSDRLFLTKGLGWETDGGQSESNFGAQKDR